MRTQRILDYADARRLIDFLIVEAGKLSNKAVIAVADPAGELIAFARMDDAPLPSIQIAINKAVTAARNQKPSREIGDRAKHPDTAFDVAYFGDSRIVGWGGGVPLTHNGECIGAVAVSGLPQVEDMRLAGLAAEKFLAGEI